MNWFKHKGKNESIIDKSDSEIIESVGMAELPLQVHYFYQKYPEDNHLIDIGGDCMFRFGEINLANVSYLATYIHFIKIDNGILTIEGNVSWPAVYSDLFKLSILINGTSYNCDLTDADFDKSIDGEVYEVRKVFKKSMDLVEDNYAIQFGYECNGIKAISGKINSMRFAPVADIIPNQFWYSNEYIVSIDKNTLILEKCSDKSFIRKLEEKYQSSIKAHYTEETAKWGIDLRNKYYERLDKKNKPIWLFMDRADRADDNAEVFFKYMQNHPEIDSYFILDNKSTDYNRLSQIGKVIDLYSEEHYLTVLLADYIISSQCNGVVENPFWDKAEMFRDLYHNGKIIFLQHGVIKDDMSPTLNRYNTNFTGFITSTKPEYQSILDYPYHYTDKEVWLTGLPIFDELEDKSEKIILVMPTWRQELMHQEWDEDSQNMKWVPNKDWTRSKYYKRYSALLNSKRLLRACRKYGYRLAFMPHPLFEPYIRDIIKNDEVLFWDRSKSYRDALSEGAILITDYSSIAFEFAYLKKLVIYYQFDRNRFFENHTYKKGYFDYERDGFGEVVYHNNEMIDMLKRVVCLKSDYLNNIKLFLDNDYSSCERIYNFLIE